VVYFIERADPETSAIAIKIGTSCRLPRRLGLLAADAGEDLRVLGVLDGGRAEEQAMHQRFARLRLANASGRPSEWFRDDPGLRAFIAEHSMPWEADAVDPHGERLVKVTLRAGVVHDARIAARLAGETFGDWLTGVVREATERVLERS